MLWAILFLVLINLLVYYLSVRNLIKQIEASQMALIMAIHKEAEGIKDHTTGEINFIDHVSTTAENFEKIHKQNRKPTKKWPHKK
jgi:predicted Holliday junction resolvase-like endonuclease